jgi:hypothetical protein
MSKTAREYWTDLNIDSYYNCPEELQAALAKADAGDWRDADADIENYNRNRQHDGRQELARSSWYLGIKNAIALILKD